MVKGNTSIFVALFSLIDLYVIRQMCSIIKDNA